MTPRSSPFIELTGELLALGYRVRFRARGSSMWPTIRDGEVLHVEPWAGRRAEVGDIVLVESAHGPLAHRIRRIDRRDADVLLWTQGDAAEEPDAAIAPAQIVGRVVAVERVGRLVSLSGWCSRWRDWLRLTASRMKRCLRPPAAPPVVDSRPLDLSIL